MQQQNLRSWLLASLCASTLLGCDERPKQITEPGQVIDDGHAIIGGLPANSASLNAIGVLGFRYEDTYYGYSC